MNRKMCKRLLFSLAPFVLCFNFSKGFFCFLQRRKAKRKVSTEMRGKMAQRVYELNVFLQKSKKNTCPPLAAFGVLDFLGQWIPRPSRLRSMPGEEGGITTATTGETGEVAEEEEEGEGVDLVLVAEEDHQTEEGGNKDSGKQE